MYKKLLCKTVKQYLKNAGFTWYEREEDVIILNDELDGTDATVKCCAVEITIYSDEIYIRRYLPVRMLHETRHQVAELIMRIHDYGAIGNFVISHGREEVYHQISILCDGESLPTEKILTCALSYSSFMNEKWAKAIMSVMLGYEESGEKVFCEYLEKDK